MQHTAGIYGFFAALAQAARQQPGQCLGWGRQVSCANGATGRGAAAPSPARCAGGISGRMQQLCFWLEWDRGTMNARDVAVKFDAYGHYIVSQEWARERLGLPSLLYVAPGIAQKRRMHLVAQGSLPNPLGQRRGRPTIEVLLLTHGPLALISTQVEAQSNQPV